METEHKEKPSLLSRIKNDKKIQYIIVGILAVIAIIIVAASYFSPSSAETYSYEDDYVSVLEAKLSSVLSEVDGAGKVSVVITVESGMETVLAMETVTTETSSGIEIVETPIVVNGKTVVLKELYPKITGVLIVAEGARSLSVLSKIQQAAVSLLDIDINSIEILTMK